MDDTMICACQCCDWTGPVSALNPMPEFDIHERVYPGEVMPYGECPKCGACCHPAEPPRAEGKPGLALSVEKTTRVTPVERRAIIAGLAALGRMIASDAGLDPHLAQIMEGEPGGESLPLSGITPLCAKLMA